MAIPKMEEDLNIIGKLGDMPGVDDGLTSQQLKEKFDQGANLIKQFLNDVLIPQMNATIDVKALLAEILDSTLSDDTKAANAKSTGDAIIAVKGIAEKALSRAGGIMTGGINMNNQPLTGVPTPVNPGNAVNKGYVDTRFITAVLAADSWNGDSAPYSQMIAAAGLADNNTCRGHPVYSGDIDADLAQMAACSCVSYAKRSGVDITFYCLTDKPETDITIELEVGV